MTLILDTSAVSKAMHTNVNEGVAVRNEGPKEDREKLMYGRF